MPIPVRYHAAFGLIMLVAGAFILGSSLLITGNLLLAGLGAFHILVAIGFLVQPAFVVQEKQIEVKNILGMTLKTHDVALADLEVRDNKLYRNGESKALAGGFFARGDDLAKVQAAIEAKRNKD
jgi:hypothetical protein